MITVYKESRTYTQPHLRRFPDYLLPDLQRLCAELPRGSRVLHVGCGNGSLSQEFVKLGHRVTGVDLSRDGIAMARKSWPQARFELLAADEDLLLNLGERPFDLVYSVEVIEHLYDPRSFLQGCFLALKPGGLFLCSTPYHGYWKNLAISLFNGWDRYANPLHERGHIRFYSKRTLRRAVRDAGFVRPKIVGSGRYPPFWRSMILSASRPAQQSDS